MLHIGYFLVTCSSATNLVSHILVFSVWRCQCCGTPRFSHYTQLRPCSYSMNLRNKSLKNKVSHLLLECVVITSNDMKSTLFKFKRASWYCYLPKNNSNMCCNRKARAASAQKLKLSACLNHNRRKLRTMTSPTHKPKIARVVRSSTLRHWCLPVLMDHCQ